MNDLSFLPIAALQRWKSVSDAMGAMGLGHLARLHGQLEGYALLLVDLEQISVEQSVSLQATAEELFIRWRAHYLSRPQKPRSKIPKRPVRSQLVHKAASLPPSGAQ
ncbi:hypothetical protein ABIC11_004453 [Pseudomonas oryzihabitans]